MSPNEVNFGLNQNQQRPSFGMEKVKSQQPIFVDGNMPKKPVPVNYDIAKNPFMEVFGQYQKTRSQSELISMNMSSLNQYVLKNSVLKEEMQDYKTSDNQQS